MFWGLKSRHRDAVTAKNLLGEKLNYEFCQPDSGGRDRRHSGKNTVVQTTPWGKKRKYFILKQLVSSLLSYT